MATFGLGGTAGLPTTRSRLGGPGTTTNPLTKPYQLYNTAVEQQAGDYGKIMEGYRNLMNQAPSSEFTASVKNLGELSRTGGLSDEDIANLRARGISPIRAAYSAASRNIDRARGLQGGYSPGYGALQSRLAREQSEQLAQGSTNVEAAIAEMRQRGRLAAAPQYAQFSNRQSEIPLQALQGQASLYGTTPALAQLYGGQALNTAQLQNQINEQGRNRETAMINSILGAYGR